MKSEFATEKDILDFINNRTLVEVAFCSRFLNWRAVRLLFDDKTTIKLDLEDCYRYKFFNFKLYGGSMKVDMVNFSEPNYKIFIWDKNLRNFIIDGCDAEEKRLENEWSEGFTNTVRGTDNAVYKHKTIINGVEFKRVSKEIYL